MMQKSRFIFPEEMLNLSERLSFLTVGHCHPVRSQDQMQTCDRVGGALEGWMDAAAQVEGEVWPCPRSGIRSSGVEPRRKCAAGCNTVNRLGWLWDCGTGEEEMR